MLGIKKLNIINFNTNNVENMSHMFFLCSSLKELNLNNFNFNDRQNMDRMFSECSQELKMKINKKYKKIKSQAF